MNISLHWTKMNRCCNYSCWEFLFCWLLIIFKSGCKSPDTTRKSKLSLSKNSSRPFKNNRKVPTVSKPMFWKTYSTSPNSRRFRYKIELSRLKSTSMILRLYKVWTLRSTKIDLSSTNTNLKSIPRIGIYNSLERDCTSIWGWKSVLLKRRRT